MSSITHEQEYTVLSSYAVHHGCNNQNYRWLTSNAILNTYAMHVSVHDYVNGYWVQPKSYLRMIGVCGFLLLWTGVLQIFRMCVKLSLKKVSVCECKEHSTERDECVEVNIWTTLWKGPSCLCAQVSISDTRQTYFICFPKRIEPLLASSHRSCHFTIHLEYDS